MSTKASAGPSLDELFGIDTRGLAAFRMAIGLLLSAEAIVRLRTVSLPTEISLAAWLELDWFLLLLCGAAIAAGRGVKWASLAAWPFLVRHVTHDLQVAGAVPIDRYLLMIGVFWNLLVPSELVGRVGGRSSEEAEPPRRVLSFATAALLIQVFIVYFSAGATKAHIEWVIRADALENLMHTRFATPLGRSLLAAPLLLKILSIGTIVLEVGGAIACFTPHRRLAAVRICLFAVATSFHLGLLLTMQLKLIPLVCQAFWLLLLPTAAWDWLWPRRDLSPTTAGESSAILSAVAKLMLAGMTASFLLSIAVSNCGPEDVLLRLHRATPPIGIFQDWRMFRSPATLRHMETSPT